MLVQRVAVAAVVISLVVPYQAFAQTQTQTQAQVQAPATAQAQSPPPAPTLSSSRVIQPDEPAYDDNVPARYKSKLFWTGVVLLNAGGFAGIHWLDQRHPLDGQPPAPKSRSNATLRVGGGLVASGLVCMIVYEARRKRETEKRAAQPRSQPLLALAPGSVAVGYQFQF